MTITTRTASSEEAQVTDAPTVRAGASTKASPGRLLKNYGALRNGSHQLGIVPLPYSVMKSGTPPGPAASSFMCMAIA